MAVEKSGSSTSVRKVKFIHTLERIRQSKKELSQSVEEVQYLEWTLGIFGSLVSRSDPGSALEWQVMI